MTLRIPQRSTLLFRYIGTPPWIAKVLADGTWVADPEYVRGSDFLDQRVHEDLERNTSH